MRLFSVVCGLFVALGSFAHAETEIIGGTVATGSEPWAKHMASVLNSSDGGMCAGTLVRQNWVLTAAHCVERASPSQLFVTFGLDGYGMSETPIRVIQVVIHPDRRPGGTYDTHDLALLQLQRAAPAPSTPAALHETPVTAGLPILFAGYGVTSPENVESLGPLRYARATLSEPQFSSTEFRVNQTAGACLGDSGGPIFAVVGTEFHLAGVVSRGDNRCRTSVGTKVERHLTWLESALK